jgi:hypothetical protein
VVGASPNSRGFFRVQAKLRFTFAWDGGFELFRTVDISASGAYVLRHIPASPMPSFGAIGECAFNLESKEIRCEAQVVRAASNGFAVRFLRLSAANEDRICAWIFRQESLRNVRSR